MKEYITGLQHIGIPTNDFKKTIEFYESLGFETYMQTKNGEDDVAFMRLKGLVIETYTGETVGKTGAIDHIAIDVTDIEKVFQLAKEGGYKILDSEINYLDFWDNGTRYFMIEGPNKERVEFNQIL